jgi:hypothetical protein
MGRARRRKHPRETAGSRSASTIPRFVDYVALAVLFGLLAAWSWRKWPDVFVDFGHELYIPWQLSEGRLLYRDITYFMGPLSQYFNALMFKLFGVSFTTLIFVNLAILAAMTLMIRHLFAIALGRGAGFVAAALFLCVFGFSQYVGLGNYNYVTPYLHEQTHGAALGVGLIVLLERATRWPSAPRVAAVGFVTGLVFLTKAEAFVPALAVVLGAGGALLAARRSAVRASLRVAGVLSAAAITPIACAGGALCAAGLGPHEMLRALAGNWIYVFDHALVLGDPYYARNLGVANASAHVTEILVVTGGLALFSLLAVVLDRRVGDRGRTGAIVWGGIAAVALAFAMDYVAWLRVARALPVVSALAIAWFGRACLRSERAGGFQTSLVLLLWSLFAMASLGKMLLHARISHYGFTLAMPSTLLLVVLLVFVVPAALRARGGSGEVFQMVSAGAVVVAVGALLGLSNLYYRAKTLPVGSGGDRVYCLDPRLDPRGQYFAAALRELEESMPAEATLAVLPDGALLNYLLRRPNPTPYYLLTPWELRAFGGEDHVFSRIVADPPDFVVLARVDMSEYGPRFFGFDPAYGERTRRWLEEHYDQGAGIGTEATLKRPWLRVYRKRDGPVPDRLPEPGIGS